MIRHITNAQTIGYHHGNLLARAQRTGERVTLPRIAWANPAYEAAYQAAKAHALAIGSR
jgi:hypothetical protein